MESNNWQTTYLSYLRTYDKQTMATVEPTAEDLRAAAKFLEEKAKELDTHILSESQIDNAGWARDKGLIPYCFRDGKFYYVYRDGTCEETPTECYVYQGHVLKVDRGSVRNITTVLDKDDNSYQLIVAV